MGNSISKDGAVTRVCESIPVVGTVTAGIQALAGNTEQAKRALAVSTGSLIKVAGAVGGFCIGGPVGAVAGGALAASVGIGAEYGISQTIKDPSVKGDAGDISLKRFAVDTVLGGATSVLGPGAGAVKEAGTQIVRAAASEIAKGMAKNAMIKAGTEMARQASQTTITQVVRTGVASAVLQASKGASGVITNPQPIPNEGGDKPGPKKKKHIIVTQMQDDRARSLEGVIQNAKAALQACHKPAIFTDDVLTDEQFGPNNESILAILKVLEGFVQPIVYGADFAQANSVYTPGQQFAFTALNNKGLKILQTIVISDNLQDIQLWRTHETALHIANSALRGKMAQGGQEVDL
ncbi:hypothetical protein E1B28_000327 [Marasmius oreades]|uniref:Uncharacterized protein n=1 Tax=Marasmius oreades TaxID=181124 RepID=A0A9P8AE86_9AGAR|nr:uncharacterized protein E1B28_000327 [Marasmius oreades]KAG7098369.1 hypothetical protein E1B28_000327 [Marasmius oreades]